MEYRQFFLTTVDVTGRIGIDLKNWVKKTDDNGQYIIDKDGNPILEEIYSVKTGTVLTINTETKKLYDEKEEIELTDISASFTPQKIEFMKAGGSYAIVFGKKLQAFACNTLGLELKSVYAPSKNYFTQGTRAYRC